MRRSFSLLSLAALSALASQAGAYVQPTHSAGPIPGELQVKEGDPVRGYAPNVGAAPAARASDWSKFLKDAGGEWIGMWDEHTGVPMAVHGSGIPAPGTVDDAAEAERFTRAFVARYIAILAPGASASDLQLDINYSDGEMRTVRLARGPAAHRPRTPKAAPMSAALRMVRLVSFAALAFGLGACAASRKGADAGGGASSGGGSSGAPSPTAVTSGSPTLAASSPGPGATAQSPAEKSASEGEPCGEQTCPPGKSCIMYYGIAGAVGPKFTACEVKCNPGGKPGCPAGQACVTIADGPGSVCRPSEK
jgi:hypothetical protein